MSVSLQHIILFCFSLFHLPLDCDGLNTLNILILSETNIVENELSERIAEESVNYTRNLFKLDFNIKLIGPKSTNFSEPKEFIEKYCDVLDSLMLTGNETILTIDVTQKDSIALAAKKLTSSLGLPTITDNLKPWVNLEPEQEDYLMNVISPRHVFTQVIKAIALSQQMENAVVLYDESFVMTYVYSTLFLDTGIRHIITPIEKTKLSRTNQLEKLKNLYLHNYFILGTHESIRNVLESAPAKLFKENFAWIGLSVEDDNTFNCPTCPNATILFVKPIMDTVMQSPSSQIKELEMISGQPLIMKTFHFDLILRGILTIKELSLKQMLWNQTYIKCRDFNGTNIPTRELNFKENFYKINAPHLFGKFIFNANSSNGRNYLNFSVSIKRINIGPMPPSNDITLAMWNSGYNNEIVRVRTRESMLNDMRVKTIYRVVTAVQEPFIFRTKDSPKGYTGFCVDLMDLIAKELNFEYEMHEADDEMFGIMRDNGEWTGMIRELMDKKAEIAISSFSVMAEREAVIDFTVPFYDLVGLGILMQKPVAEQSLFKFLTVLEPNVWFCILAAYFFTSFLLWAFDRYSPFSYQNNTEEYKDDHEKRVFDFKECLWFCMTSLTPQGGGEAPKNLSGRLIAATWWLFGFIIIASYTANLAAFLTVSRLDTPIESLDDLANQYKITYGPMQDSVAADYFQRMSDIENRFYEIWRDMSLNDSLTPIERSKLAVWDYPISTKYTKMWRVFQETGMVMNMIEAVARIRNSTTASGYAYIGDGTDIRFQVLQNCDLQVVGEEFSRKPYAIGLQRGSPLRHEFNKVILELLNNRELEKLKKKWWTRSENEQCAVVEDQMDGISIYNIGGVFIIIFVGIGMAFITLIIEYFWHKRNRNQAPSAIIISSASTGTTGVSTREQDNRQTVNRESTRTPLFRLQLGASSNGRVRFRINK